LILLITFFRVYAHAAAATILRVVFDDIAAIAAATPCYAMPLLLRHAMMLMMFTLLRHDIIRDILLMLTLVVALAYALTFVSFTLLLMRLMFSPGVSRHYAMLLPRHAAYYAEIYFDTPCHAAFS